MRRMAATSLGARVARIAHFHDQVLDAARIALELALAPARVSLRLVQRKRVFGGGGERRIQAQRSEFKVREDNVPHRHGAENAVTGSSG